MFLLISTFSSQHIYVVPFLTKRTEAEKRNWLLRRQISTFIILTQLYHFIFLLSIVLQKDTVDIVLPIRVSPLAYEMLYFSVFISRYPCFKDDKPHSSEHQQFQQCDGWCREATCLQCLCMSLPENKTIQVEVYSLNKEMNVNRIKCTFHIVFYAIYIFQQFFSFI